MRSTDDGWPVRRLAGEGLSGGAGLAGGGPHPGQLAAGDPPFRTPVSGAPVGALTPGGLVAASCALIHLTPGGPVRGALAGAGPGGVWFVQPGRPPQPYGFRGVPVPATGQAPPNLTAS